MYCYECFQAGVTQDAVGLCHTAQLRFASNMLGMVTDPVTDILPLMWEVVLPKHARLLLCGTCKAALEQPRV
jgi:hypothetical protein